MSGAPSASALGLRQRLADFFSWRVLLAIFFWGISFPFTKAALVTFHPNGLIAARMGLGVLVLALFAAVRRERWLVEARDRKRCAVLGVILGLHLSMQAFAMQLTSSISSGWIIAFNPVVLALGGALFLGERIRRVGWLGMFVASAGVCIVAAANSFDFAGATRGDLLILLSCITWPAFTLLAAGPTASSGSLRVTLCSMALAGVLCTAAALRSGFTVAPFTSSSAWATLFLGVLCNGVSFVLWMQALDLEGAAKISAMLYFQPFVTMFWAAGFDGEPITVFALVGGPTVIVGVWLLRLGSPKHARPSRTGDARAVSPGTASVES
ncbi:MAG: DMT family transporter [Planctomycetes bacterium]|nr:DMT family transporter [Planctomycetota bacterium]